MKTTNPTTLAARRYKLQLAVAMGVYLVILYASLTAIERYDPQGTLRWLLALAPVVPIAFLVPIVARFFRDTDELERRLTTEAFAIGAAVTAMLSVTYAFLENTGLPHLSAWWTWTVLMASAAIARIALSFRYR